MYQLGFGRDGLRDKPVHLGLVASRVGASVLGNIGEEQRVSSSALGAIDTGSGGGVDVGVGL